MQLSPTIRSSPRSERSDHPNANQFAKRVFRCAKGITVCNPAQRSEHKTYCEFESCNLTAGPLATSSLRVRCDNKYSPHDSKIVQLFQIFVWILSGMISERSDFQTKTHAAPKTSECLVQSENPFYLNAGICPQHLKSERTEIKYTFSKCEFLACFSAD